MSQVNWSNLNNSMSALAILNQNNTSSKWQGLNNDLFSTVMSQYGTNTADTPDPIKTYLSDSKNAAGDIKSALDSVAKALENRKNKEVGNTSELEDVSEDTTESTDATESTENKLAEQDKELVNAMRSVVNGFNKLMDSAYGVEDSGAGRLVNQLAGVGKTYANSLAEIGITFNENGFMEINESTMSKAAESGRLESFVNDGGNGRSYGFMSRVDQIATRVSNDPVAFLSFSAGKSINATMDSMYANAARVGSYTTNLSAAYNNGMLFDSMF